jgi:His-Xaa-Ser system radical SAM maturase HxsC
MKLIHGIPVNINHSIIGRVSKSNYHINWRRNSILVSDKISKWNLGYSAVLTNAQLNKETTGVNYQSGGFKGIVEINLEDFSEDDIVILNLDGSVKQVWDADAFDNVVMITNTCNCDCIMCPQPSCADPINLFDMNSTMLSLVNPKYSGSIGFTGGEPTLKLVDLCKLLELCKKRLKKAPVQLLTNGKRYSSFEVVRQIALICHPGLTHCISINSDVSDIHDKIMGVSGSFEQTILGLHNLALFKQRIELRVVIQSDNYKRLPNLAEFIYHNFPFVAHIALMGMETTGLAYENLKKVWIDPREYVFYLKKAVRLLHQRELDVSIYNLPLCILPHELWKYCRDAISAWKKIFVEECDECTVRNKCSGLFKTSKMQVPGICAIK